MRLEQIREDWWIPIEENDGWVQQQIFDYERELYELREWWCRPHQVTQQIELPLGCEHE
jgi:hypothetical protein